MVASALRLLEGVVAEKTAALVERLARLLAEELVERGAVGEKLVGAPPVEESGPTERVPSGVRDAILFSDSGEAAAAAKLETPLTVGSVVASDAFFPFPDGMLAAADAGATAVIQPGGSMRDADVIAAADERGLAMVFTGIRHFRH